MENELVTEVAGIQAGIRRMDQAVEAKKVELAAIERQVADAKVVRDKLTPIVESLRKERESLISQCKEYEDKIETLRAEYRKLRAPLDAIPT